MRHWASQCSRYPTGTRPRRRNSRPVESRHRPLGVARAPDTPAHWGSRHRSHNRSEHPRGKAAASRVCATNSGGTRRRGARRSPGGKAMPRTRPPGNQRLTNKCRARRRRHLRSRPQRPPRSTGRIRGTDAGSVCAARVAADFQCPVRAAKGQREDGRQRTLLQSGHSLTLWQPSASAARNSFEGKPQQSTSPGRLVSRPRGPSLRSWRRLRCLASLSCS
jgi:hypothetical protein